MKPFEKFTESERLAILGGAATTGQVSGQDYDCGGIFGGGCKEGCKPGCKDGCKESNKVSGGSGTILPQP